MFDSRLVRSSPDLVRLVEEGYAVRIVNGFLVVGDVPFVDDAAQVQSGALLCPLDSSGDATTTPSTHVMCFVGGVPRDKDGRPIDGLVHEGVERWSAAPDLTAACGFSQKPEGGYPNFYEKVTYYAAMIVGPAQAVDPTATPFTGKPVVTDEDDGVFVYVDTYSSRAGLTELNGRVALNKVVIVGLGGTGAYLLDLLVKTPVVTLHLYDDDLLRTHNAFRAPGAASVDHLRARMKKVEYYEQMYSMMRRGVTAHPVNVTAENVEEILDADFVFLAMDTGPDKEVIIHRLMAERVPFIDTGVGLSRDPNGINGQIRITTSTPGRTEHIERDGLVSYFAGDDAEYDTNVQITELNAITANLAVVRYKKLLGFYADVEDERHTVYAVDSNDLHHRYGVSQSEAKGESDDSDLESPDKREAA